MIENQQTLPLAESFYSIQGEGCHAGMPAYFIRLAGCDVCCSFCDSRATWNVKRFPQVEIESIIHKIMSTKACSAVITGGEPCIHNLEYLTACLKECGISTFLETSGSHPITGLWDWICLSPKLNKPPLTENLLLANEIKVIIQHEEDFKWAEENAKLEKENCLKFLQVEWSVSEQMLPLIIEYVKENPTWSLSLQTHKYIGIE